MRKVRSAMSPKVRAGEERTLLVTENIPFAQISAQILSRPNSVRAAFVRNELIDGWRDAPPSIEVIAESAVYDESAPGERTRMHASYSEVYHSVISDVRSLFIAERLWASSFMTVQGAFKNATRIAGMCWNVLSILDRVQPTRIVCASTPHATCDWLLARIAQHLGIPIYIIGASPIPWRAWCLSGLDEQSPIPLADLGHRPDAATAGQPVPSPEVHSYVSVNAGDNYTAALPTVDRLARELPDSRKKDRDHHQFVAPDPARSRLDLNPRSLAKRYLRRTRNARDRRALLETYRRLARPVPRDVPYVSMLLHYQPERTTMPEGRGFANQLAAICSLAVTLPAGWRLVVKEHPAIFQGPGPFRSAFRDPFLYRAIAAMPNVSLAPLETSPFTLIDGSRLVATVTGTVGFQSVCRGKPVLAFGAAAYRGAPGVYPVPVNVLEHGAALAQCFKEVQSGAPGPSIDALLEYLGEVERNSIGQFGVADDAFGSSVFWPTIEARTEAMGLLVP